jgi:NADH-quinone oxidoreductase subunit M
MGDEIRFLSILIWLPILGGLFVIFVGTRCSDLLTKSLALGVSLMAFIISLMLWSQFNNSLGSMQFTELAQWIPAFGIQYSLGVDGIALPLIILTTFTTSIVVVAGWTVIKDRQGFYLGAFLLLEGLMIGVFSSLDVILFYVFWEAMLIPMFLIIGIWGGPRRVYATIKFFLYTFMGSLFMLVALLYLYFRGGSFDVLTLHSLGLTMSEQKWIFVAFLLAFAVKVPMWPVHTWLPDAHVEAPTGGSIILAAVMLKLGGYGFLRFSLPIAPDASMALDGMMIALSLIAIVYIGFVALAQQDMKKLIAYSSISHMGFVTLGIFVVFQVATNTGDWRQASAGIEGGMVQMISHGFISGAMFLCVGVLYDRMHSREIGAYGGVVNTMPLFAAFLLLFAMANAGLPGTSGFVGEFIVILTAFKAQFWYAFLAATTLILGAAYTLWMYKRVVFGEIKNSKVAELSDINTREFSMLSVLATMVLLLGIWPDPLFDMMRASVEQLALHISQSKLP